jgi:hypothetical protein
MHCPQCGREVPEGSVQCPYCSAPLAAPAPPPDAPVVPTNPHRGVLVLVFGILGIVCCFAFGIAAWVMGNGDIAEMDAGRMDPSGRGLTLAGKIVGIVSVALAILSTIGWIIMLVMGAALPALGLD